MPRVADREVESSLLDRLASVRRRLWLAATFRGVCWLVSFVLLTAAWTGFLDWCFHTWRSEPPPWANLPLFLGLLAVSVIACRLAVPASSGIRRSRWWVLAPVVLAAILLLVLRFYLRLLDRNAATDLPGVLRAGALAWWLTGAGLISYLLLLRPLAVRRDNLSLALRIEEQNPALNDSLASAVQFLERGIGESTIDSPQLRQEAVRRATRRVCGQDFDRVVNTSGLEVAGMSLLMACAVAVGLLLFYPTLARTALVRLADPFGRHAWPPQTRIELEPFRTRIARNELFEVRATLRGLIPESATVVFRPDGQAALEQKYEIHAAAPDHAMFTARLEPSRVQRDFQFQVRAHDGVTEWQRIAVLPPPILVPLDGRASPQVRLQYPRYTDLPPQGMPEGSGNVEAVAGTLVTLRAATDRPLSRAWVEFVPENRFVPAAAFFGPLGASHFSASLTLTAAGQAVWDRVPARLEGDGRMFSLSFLPRVSGMYALFFEDETGLGNGRLFELRLESDPAPTVNLERPSPKTDILDLLSDAEFTLRAGVEDTTFAVRNVYVEYRIRRESDGASPGFASRIPLYEHALIRGGASLLADMAPASANVLRAKRQQLPIDRRLSLKQFRVPGVAQGELREGDVVVLQVCADDFDDVALDKEPGRSHEVELRIVGRNALEVILNREQGRIQQDLVKLREQQREALKKVTEAEKRLNREGKLTPEEADKLVQAEQIQQQIRERVGTKQEGLRAEANRILESLKDNKLPRSATQDRMEMVAGELDRLARQELEQIEPRLTNARKQAETPPEKQKASKDDNPLAEARQHQEEVEKTLTDLLTRLEPWSSTREIKGEAKAILQEQRDLNQELENTEKELGKGRDELTPPQKTELDRQAAAQQKLQERTGQLLEKMDRVRQDREAKDPETAQELQKAHEAGTRSNITGTMQQAQKQISANNLREASKTQKQAADKLQELVKELEDKREAELDRLAKKLRETEGKLNDLTQRQEDLQKRVKDAGQIADPKKREEVLKRLAREQEQLQKEAQEMAKQLSRMRQDRAGQALARAGGQMEQAGRQMDQGQKSEDEQEEALDRLDEARRELERARETTEEELQREQIAKVADAIKRLKERQEGYVTEAGRIHKEVLQQKGWTRVLKVSLREMGGNQAALGKETERLADDKLPNAAVFARILHKSAKAMQDAGERFIEYHSAPQGTEIEPEAVRLQQEALRRLEQLLDALKPENALAQRPPPRNGEQGGEGGGEQGGGGAPGDGIPRMAQLKLLRSLQAEVNQRTEEFGKQHPDPMKLTEKEKTELQAIRRGQQEVTEMLNELTQAADREGGKP